MVKRVLFACIGNAMRSQMAEGFGIHWAAPGAVEVRSGGTRPTGWVHPAAIRVMAEKGIDISGQSSKPIDVAFAQKADALVTLCGPLDPACPRPLAQRALDWTLQDPSWGGDPEVRACRDEIERRVKGLYEKWGVLR